MFKKELINFIFLQLDKMLEIMLISPSIILWFLQAGVFLMYWIQWENIPIVSTKS